MPNQEISGVLLNIIGHGTLVEGAVTSPGDLRVDGQIHGAVTVASRLAIGSTGLIEGDVICDSADFSGIVKGNVTCRGGLHLKKTARIEGDITVTKLIVESGAEFLGSCTMLNNLGKSKSSNG